MGIRLKDIFGEPDNGVVKDWVIWARVPLALLAVGVFVYLCVQLYPSVTAPSGAGQKAPNATAVTAATKLLYAAWTIAVPLYFFCETVFGVVDPPFDERQKAKFDRFKASQDAARAVWAGCAAAIGVLILKPGS